MRPGIQGTGTSSAPQGNSFRHCRASHDTSPWAAVLRPATGIAGGSKFRCPCRPRLAAAASRVHRQPLQEQGKLHGTLPLNGGPSRPPAGPWRCAKPLGTLGARRARNSPSLILSAMSQLNTGTAQRPKAVRNKSSRVSRCWGQWVSGGRAVGQGRCGRRLISGARMMHFRVARCSADTTSCICTAHLYLCVEEAGGARDNSDAATVAGRVASTLHTSFSSVSSSSGSPSST